MQQIQIHRYARLAAAIAVAFTCILSPQVAFGTGTTAGNGCCYDDHTGKYCGKGSGTTGASCECGVYGIHSPFIGLELRWIGHFVIDGFTTPDFGDPELELWLWNGDEYTFESRIMPGQTINFAKPTDRFVLQGIDPELDIDPTNQVAFPMSLHLVSGIRWGGETEGLWIPSLGDIDVDGFVGMSDLLALQYRRRGAHCPRRSSLQHLDPCGRRPSLMTRCRARKGIQNYAFPRKRSSSTTQARS